ncbi:MAG: 3-phosphoserine/phosphohydroxythreonine transaminase [Pirellulaceae bacterium]|nr:3-phosphoserine/phosphohydroxythreonine transaminase [Pirellulaceae bacterium]
MYLSNSENGRVYNFSAGPATLPLPVLKQIEQELISLPGVGSSILEISHRGKAFISILEETQEHLRQLLSIPTNYKILFLQGGGRLQFSMIPMNFLKGRSEEAEYLVTGTWGKLAAEQAKMQGPVNILYNGKDHNYSQLPDLASLSPNPNASYLHYTSNETIQGIQFSDDLQFGDIPMICDASSDILHRSLDIQKYGLIYACAQKNIGPAGVTLVIVREDLLDKVPNDLPCYLDYRNHAEHNSMYNTSPTFPIYVVNLVCRWLQKTFGDLESVHKFSQQKAALLYEQIDTCKGFYTGHARTSDRSLMNVVFRLPNEELTTLFLQQAADQNLTNLAGHRSVGGIRASIYNAMPLAGVQELAKFMANFYKKNS